MTPGDRLRKIRRRASQLHKQHPGWTYQTALKDAGREFRDKKPKGKKKSVGMGKRHGSAKVVSKSRTVRGRVGAVHPVTTASMKSAIVREAEEKLAWMLLARDSAKGVKERKEKAKKVVELRRKLKTAKSL